MAEWNVDKGQNQRVDALTHRFNEPVQFNISTGEDLKTLRRLWSERESIPCFVGGRDAAANHSWPGMDVRTLLAGDNSSGRLSYHDVVVAPGGGLPPHFHDIGDTSIYVVDGTIDLTIGHLTERSGSGSLGYAPAHTTQAIRNNDAHPARLLIVYSPAGVDRAFLEAHEHWLASQDASDQPYLAILSRYGIHFNTGAASENDSLTNTNPQRVEYEIESLTDYNALREVWARHRPVPKLIHSFESCPRIDAPSSQAKVIVSGDECGGSGVMFYTAGQPGFDAGAHFQPTEEEAFYMLDGRLQLTCGSETREVGAGAFAFAPRGATHGFVTKEPLHMITMNTPAGHERGFEMIKRETHAPSGRFQELFIAHGWRWRNNVPPG